MTFKLSRLYPYHFKHFQILNHMPLGTCIEKGSIVQEATFSIVWAKNLLSSKEQHCYISLAAIKKFLSVGEIVVQCVAWLALTGHRVGWLSWCDIIVAALPGMTIKRSSKTKRNSRGIATHIHKCEKSRIYV